MLQPGRPCGGKVHLIKSSYTQSSIQVSGLGTIGAIGAFRSWYLIWNVFLRLIKNRLRVKSPGRTWDHWCHALFESEEVANLLFNERPILCLLGKSLPVYNSNYSLVYLHIFVKGSTMVYSGRWQYWLQGTIFDLFSFVFCVCLYFEGREGCLGLWWVRNLHLTFISPVRSYPFILHFIQKFNYKLKH